MSPRIARSTYEEANGRPFWSVMIPTFNPNPDFLKATLRAVLDQDPGSDEMQIEVIDDASFGNDIIELVNKLAGDRIYISTEPKNLGLAGIWNKCIERARGEWIHILHQDDLVYPGFYEALRLGIEKHPEAGAAFCRHAYCDGYGHWTKLSILESPDPAMLARFVEPLVTGYHIQCAAIVVKQETYQRLGGFDTRLRHALDWEMWIRIANSFSFFYHPGILAAWRNHEAATTSGQMRSGENMRDIRQAIEIWKTYLPEDERKVYYKAARKRVAKEALFGASKFAEEHDLVACRLQLLEAIGAYRSGKVLLAAGKIWLKALVQSFGKRQTAMGQVDKPEMGKRTTTKAISS